MTEENIQHLWQSEGRLTQLVEEFGRVCKRRKLRVNECKKKVMKCTRKVDDRTVNVMLNAELLDEEECFHCLRSHVVGDGGIDR